MKVELLVFRGCYSYSPDQYQRLEGGVELPCPQADRFRKRALKKRRERRRRARMARERRAREKRRKSRERSRRRRAARRGRGRSRRSRRRRSRGRGRPSRRRGRRSTRSRRRRGRRSARGRGREQHPKEIDAIRMMTNDFTDLAKQPIPTRSCSGSLLSNDRPHSDHSTISGSSGKKQE